MDLPSRALSAFTIPPLYRLGERSLLLKGSRIRNGIFRVLENVSRSRAESARRVFNAAPSQPAYLDASQLDEFIEHYYREPKLRSDGRFPHEKADERAAEIIQNTRRARFSGREKPRFLDIACADGLTADAIEKLNGEVVAIDLSDQNYIGGAEFRNMDAATLSFDDNSFDVAYNFDTFEHFGNPEAVLSETHRVLKPGGMFYASFGPLYNSPHGAHQFLSIDVPYCHHLFREEDCNAAAAKRGLRPLTKNLNFWSLRDFRKLFDEFSDRFETVYRFEKFNVAFVDLIRQYPSCFRSKVDDFDELIVRSIEVLLRKKG
ncbi:MAG TPA: methyltransferase domain-containing protein [Tepidisphaeraceae bacterium]|jgi:SAM-dependent methyltransferase|nr:methyltransferase domain-containing protein [Tepidisphaeraceae bacterium]